jgi:hypothetical protein
MVQANRYFAWMCYSSSQKDEDVGITFFRNVGKRLPECMLRHSGWGPPISPKWTWRRQPQEFCCCVLQVRTSFHRKCAECVRKFAEFEHGCGLWITSFRLQKWRRRLTNGRSLNGSAGHSEPSCEFCVPSEFTTLQDQDAQTLWLVASW